MRLCYVVQRYGPDIAGGAEQACRMMAERMATRGHTVEVVTTCAESYVDWADRFPPGTTTEAGVAVHRFRVVTPRRNDLFGDYHRRVLKRGSARPALMQYEWMRMQGPNTPALVEWLKRNAGRFDCVVCFTYLYWPTWAALRTLAGRVPLVLYPTVHDEPPLRLAVFDEVFHAPDAFAFLTPEEIDIVRDRFRIEPVGEVVGIGVDTSPADPDRFREAFGLGDSPYVLYVGRIDPSKGAEQLVDYFRLFKDRNAQTDVKLVLLGAALIEDPAHPDIVMPGFVDYDLRDSALAGCHALVQPSYYESFSMVLTEAFAHGRPALVQKRCTVLDGHARRSGAALPYDGFAEFECGLEMLLEDPERADRMGQAGRRYVEREYDWDVVLSRYEALLERTVARVRPAV